MGIIDGKGGNQNSRYKMENTGTLSLSRGEGMGPSIHLEGFALSSVRDSHP